MRLLGNDREKRDAPFSICTIFYGASRTGKKLGAMSQTPAPIFHHLTIHVTGKDNELAEYDNNAAHD